MKKEKKNGKTKITPFAIWPLGAKGELTRKEIYEYLGKEINKTRSKRKV